eukprot:TRINITY_DN2800_c1_g1_i1.p1 TRINITY_DN2800_c1_g1~~TRINITY_DN2800_c1_g1_i1.p1  ORF type:complete len:666 (-),score=190.41 TRINITY_DN2800_c1_g1_i1:73-2070(-)
MGSMHTGMEDKFEDFPSLAKYFGERAKGGAGLIVTGGIAPNIEGWIAPFAGKLTTKSEAEHHKQITKAVHIEDGKICMQILHAGRYAYHPLAVAPSSIKSPISPFAPWKLPKWGIKKQISNFTRCAELAQYAGYDGVEVMGSEGYLINEFLVNKTNKRTDEYGGSLENRMRFPLEIVRSIRERVGKEFIIIYRLSMLDLVEEGSSWDEVVRLAQEIEKAGATIINTGIGWHEARIPTIATCVPRANYAWVTKNLKGKVNIPLITTNRINTPEIAEKVLSDGCADMVSMARPFLADPEFLNKAFEGRRDEINICIACNQACLDFTFLKKRATCLVNPRAGYETELNYLPTNKPLRVAVIGAGPAGLAASTVAAKRGHNVTLFDKNSIIGGQFNYAKLVPGKEEFNETLSYFKRQIELTGLELKLNTTPTPQSILDEKFDVVLVCTGVVPNIPRVIGIDHKKVFSYIDVITGKAKVGNSVAIIGAGGIGFDVAEFLSHDPNEVSPSLDINKFSNIWGIEKLENDLAYNSKGGLKKDGFHKSYRKIYMLQRKATKMGGGLGKTTGWIKRIALSKQGVTMLSGVNYDKIDDDGIHISTGENDKKETKILNVDNVVVCAGQISIGKEFKNSLEQLGFPSQNVHLVGGAFLASELDARRAIRQASEIASKL